VQVLKSGVECIGVIDYCEKYQKLSGVLLIYSVFCRIQEYRKC